MINLADFASSLLIVSVAGIVGYWFRSVWNYTKFSMLRESGHHLLYNSRLFGCFALLVLYAFFSILHSQIEAFKDNWALRPIDVAIYITVVLGVILPYLLNCLFFNDERKYLIRTMENYGDSLYLIFLEAYENNHSIELTLKNDKIVIGRPKKQLKSRYGYVDVSPHDGSYPISIKAEEIVAVRRVDLQDFEQERLSNE